MLYEFRGVVTFAYPRWKGRVVVGVAVCKSQSNPTSCDGEINSPNSKRSVLQAKLRYSDSQCTSCITDTSTHEDSCA